MKKRLDLLMVERALAPSREKAKAYIMSGDVYVNGQKEDKAGTMFAGNSKDRSARKHTSICKPRRSETRESHERISAFPWKARSAWT